MSAWGRRDQPAGIRAHCWSLARTAAHNMSPISNLTQTMGGHNGSMICQALWGRQLLSGFLFKEVLTNPDTSGAYNPDILGYGVRLSNFVTNICAGLLILFGGPGDIRPAIQNTLLQIGALLLGTLVSSVRGQLTFYDGLFTLVAVHSPILWYILFRGFYSMSRCRPVDKARHFTPLLSSAVALLWISLDLVLWFKGPKKLLGDNCDSLTFKDYMVWVVIPLSTPGATFLSVDVVFFTLNTFGFTSLWLLHKVRYTRLARVSDSRQFDTISLPPLWTRLINGRYFFFAISPYWAWSFQLEIWAVEPGYVFTYGQSLSIIAAAMSVIPVLKLIMQFNKEDYLQMCTDVASHWVFLIFGSNAARINTKYLQDRLTIPPHKLVRREASAPTLPDVPFAGPTSHSDSTHTSTTSGHNDKSAQNLRRVNQGEDAARASVPPPEASGSGSGSESTPATVNSAWFTTDVSTHNPNESRSDTGGSLASGAGNPSSYSPPIVRDDVETSRLPFPQRRSTL
ncbi:hypothetical protein MVEN_01749400 [Mycena venus]|uniref:Uncharacterized protein n=1 Tax=Mycena venus TaxID=2733690 RepID=A0A8H7CP76_9AGAR|nr:hypothetical protein MVEN_01749400 [Mycena venus]